MSKRILPLLMIALCSLLASAQDYQRDFIRAQQLFDARDPKAAGTIKTYLNHYAYSPYVDEVNLMQGILLCEKQKYKQADKQLAAVHANHLSRSSQLSYWFYRGFTLLQLQQYTQAISHLKNLRSKQNPYTTQARYYIGYCYYSLSDFDHALPELLDVEQRGAFLDIVPYYIVQIDYARHHYDDVLTRATHLLQSYPDNPRNTELNRILGEINFAQHDYPRAVSLLTSAHTAMSKAKQTFPRTDFYLLGMAHYHLNNYADALRAFKQVSTQQDSISESTCLHMGHCYLKLNDEEKAKLAFSAASQFRLNTDLREEAMFNYLQITYHQSSALGESIRAFRDFLTEFPHTKHADTIHQLLADMLRTSRDYVGALKALDAITRPNTAMLDTKQYLRYQLSLDALLRGDIPTATRWANAVMKNASTTSTYKSEALFILSECHYRRQHIDSSLITLNQFINQPRINQSPNYTAALYMRAYALFNLQRITEAQTAFTTYIQHIDSTNKQFPDALNRIGDCCFNQRQFTAACQAYQRVVNIRTIGVDYALYRLGIAYGLQHRYTDKIHSLSALTTTYPQSDYAAEALYEIARANLQLDQNTEALNAYQQLLSDYPNATFAAKASLEMAMVYRTLHRYDDAINTFQHTIISFPGSEEAYTALEGLEQVSVETNHLNDYLAFTRQLGHLNMRSLSQEDSLLYVTAELQYMNAHYTDAVTGMRHYIASYCPGGRYCTAALHYIASAYFQLDSIDAALDAYYQLADIQSNPYMEEACMRIAQISFDQQQYRTAALYFRRMLETASSTTNRQIARLGILRCQQNLGTEQAVIDAASELLNEPTIDEAIRAEALFYRANAYMNRQQYGLAIVDFTPLAHEVRTANGAQSKYSLAQCYFALGSLDLAEEEVMAFTKMQTTQQYWLARALILLSDIALARHDLFQARQYLLALQSNYHRTDDIAGLIEQRLQHITQLEQSNQTLSVDSL